MSGTRDLFFYRLLPSAELQTPPSEGFGDISATFSRRRAEQRTRIGRHLFLDVFSEKFLSAVEKDPEKYGPVLRDMGFNLVFGPEKAWAEFNKGQIGSRDPIILSEINLNQENEINGLAPKTEPTSEVWKVLERIATSILEVEQKTNLLDGRLQDCLRPAEPTPAEEAKRESGGTKIEEQLLVFNQKIQAVDKALLSILKRLAI